MIRDMRRVTVTMEQIDHVLRALEDLRQSVLPSSPQLFATLAEAPLDDFQRLRKEVNDCVKELGSSS